jgi:hypothetical protein
MSVKPFLLPGKEKGLTGYMSKGTEVLKQLKVWLKGTFVQNVLKFLKFP